MNKQIVSALIGLVGAVETNGKTEHTDEVISNALLHCFEQDDLNKEQFHSAINCAENTAINLEASILTEIRKEKFTISPNCETCPTPCGNTSAFDMSTFYENNEVAVCKEEMLREAFSLVLRLHANGKTELPEEIYRALSYVRYDLSKDSYQALTETLKHME